MATDLRPLFAPKVIAVVGAHDSRPPLDEFTRRVMTKATSVGAACYLVNPTRPEVYGVATIPSTDDIPEEIDVLVVLVGDAAGAIERAAPKRPKFTVVFAGGYREVGTPEGEARHQQLVAAVRRVGTRLLGPNTNSNTLEPLRDLPGPKIGLISQSGMQGRPIAQAQELGVALSGWAVTGNEADLGVADFIGYMAREPGTQAILAYVEGFGDGDVLRAAALEALQEDTPVVVIKVGRSAAGAAASLTHTGHLAGSDVVHDAFFEQFGITRVDDLDELLDVGMVLSRVAVPPVGGVGLLCTSGGSAAHIADLVSARGLPLPPLSDATQATLRRWIPSDYQVANPVDNGGVALLQGHGPDIAEAMLADDAIGFLYVPVTGVFPPHMPHVYETVRRAHEFSDKPLIVIWSGPTTNDTHQALLDLGVPVVRNIRHALAATEALLARRALLDHRKELAEAARRLGPLVLPSPAGTRTLDELDSMRWLGVRGLPFVEHEAAGSVDEAVAAAERLGYPVVLKGRVPGVVHKTDAGLVALGLAGPEEVRRAAAEMARVQAPVGWVVARQCSGGVELIAGVSHDPIFGPVVTVGAGGIYAEVLSDAASSVLPLIRSRAVDMLDKLRIAPLLDGYRGAPAVEREAVIDVLLALARIAAEGEVEEVDVNPLLATADGVLGLDAVVRLRC
jgi:acetate---CoA ligase (ADP-forming)